MPGVDKLDFATAYVVGLLPGLLALIVAAYSIVTDRENREARRLTKKARILITLAVVAFAVTGAQEYGDTRDSMAWAKQRAATDTDLQRNAAESRRKQVLDDARQVKDDLCDRDNAGLDAVYAGDRTSLRGDLEGGVADEALRTTIERLLAPDASCPGDARAAAAR